MVGAVPDHRDDGNAAQDAPAGLARNRWYSGGAVFCHAAGLVVLGLIDKGWADAVLAQVPLLRIWTGWLAFAAFIPLAGAPPGRRVGLG